jgi:hypothetical protein
MAIWDVPQESLECRQSGEQGVVLTSGAPMGNRAHRWDPAQAMKAVSGLDERSLFLSPNCGIAPGGGAANPELWNQNSGTRKNPLGVY